MQSMFFKAEEMNYERMKRRVVTGIGTHSKKNWSPIGESLAAFKNLGILKRNLLEVV